MQLWSTPNCYPLGTKVRLTATFTDPLDDDAPIDPTEVFVTVKNPDGAVVTKQYTGSGDVGRESAGVYTFDVDANAAGDWYYRWHSTGAGQAAGEDRFKVSPTKAEPVAVS